ncbi:hypothetical protein [Streptomyces sp. NPDC058272]|uniref:hypothetical protein n=1 Tax=Streptomyces sp. NPDC058272 TaxID=3346415 RepID=UPI0036E7F623
MTSMEAQCAEHRGKLRYEPFATIIPDRRPAVKYHPGLGRAKSAVGWSGGWSGVRGGEIYEHTADGWALLFRVEAGTPADELPWRESQ